MLENNRLLFYGGWVLKIVAGLAFVVAGGSKLAGDEQLVLMFDQIGVGQWFRYVTGLIEVIGGVLLFVPGRAIYGAGLLICTMVGAIITHQIIGGSALPAVGLLVVCLAIAWLHRGQLTRSG